MNATYFDFFHYGRIHREVYLCAHSKIYVKDVTIKTHIEGADGIVKVETLVSNEEKMIFSGKLSQVFFNADLICED
ncbi:hypothetical protein J7L97_00460 [Candidatus Bathyarchaeota archaeon]|nr:hypothetical protein [Candidatus Bathyarchaeota archaeon]